MFISDPVKGCYFVNNYFSPLRHGSVSPSGMTMEDFSNFYLHTFGDLAVYFLLLCSVLVLLLLSLLRTIQLLTMNQKFCALQIRVSCEGRGLLWGWGSTCIVQCANVCAFI